MSENFQGIPDLYFRVQAYITTLNSQYKLTDRDDFTLLSNGDSTVIAKWDLNSPDLPTRAQIEAITQEQVDAIRAKRKATVTLDVFESLDDVLEPISGNLIIHEGTVKVYDGKVWASLVTVVEAEIQALTQRIRNLARQIRELKNESTQ